jgi:lipopolysaccharide transport system ATP-binding protein
MYMRLAFAVAAHLETDILIVDEALAVGDAAFQKKCMGKIGGVAHDGRTVLFVSHSMPAVESLCQRAIRLDKGRLVDDGVPTAVITRYLSQGTPNETLCEDMHSAPGNKALRFRSARACAAVPDPDEPITVRTPVNLEFSYWVLQPSPSLTLVIQVFNRNGTLVFDSGVKLPEDSTAGLYRSGCRIAGDILNDGIHRVNLIFYCEEEVVMELDNAVVFDVLDSRDLSEDYFGEWPGAVRLNVGWRTERVIA